MAVLYNPCKDGFHAKVWECLRRNAKFVRAFNEALAFGRGLGRAEGEERERRFRSYIDAKYRDGPINYFAREVLVTCTGGWRLDACWCELEVNLRKRLEAQYKIEWPEPVSHPDLSACETERGFDAVKAVEVLRGAYRHGSDFTLIAVPRFIRDNLHHREVLAKVRQLIGGPMVDARWLKPRGRVLGRAGCWESYLLYEAWEKLGFGPEEAAHLTASERFGLKEPLFDLCPATAKRNAEVSLGRRFKKHKHAKTVEQQVGTIKWAIITVFPVFKPFVD